MGPDDAAPFDFDAVDWVSADTHFSHARIIELAHALVEVVLLAAPFSPWRQGAERPPSTSWIAMFESFTGDDTADEWGLAAAILVARTRHRTGHGPTFSELFIELIPGTDGVPAWCSIDGGAPHRTRTVRAFRLAVLVEWKRRGWIYWDKAVERSLRVGRGFRERARLFRAGRPDVDMKREHAD